MVNVIQQTRVIFQVRGISNQRIPVRGLLNQNYYHINLRKRDHQEMNWQDLKLSRKEVWRCAQRRHWTKMFAKSVS